MSKSILGKIAPLVAAATLVSACESASGPSQAEVIRALPVTSLDDGLREFEAVCLDGKTDAPDDPFLFNIDQTSEGLTVCSMRARAPENVNVSSTLGQRFGPMRSAGIASRLVGYPRGNLLLQLGVVNGAGAGTYQLGIVRG
ncbi:hypothetical protein [Roseobacter sp. CCS2]|uniref:hypothetical protein n=1 Tax=Roseobacter sp. CCS2 TaxID=391593 RepID=UPI0012EA620B|nr:hypothetical protein [Roseobacter sp. CCS2]